MSEADAPFVIGLTGPIGCGKSTIARMLAELGAVIIDADLLARQATAPGESALLGIRSRFGDGVFDDRGALDREALAKVVFDDPVALRDLEAMVHPEVRRLVEEGWADARAAGALILVVEAIKLVQGGLAEQCDEVWLVECGADEQRERLANRGLDPLDLERRLAAQATMIDRLAPAATRRIVTSGDLATTRDRVEEALADSLTPALMAALTSLAGSGRAG